MLRYLVVILSVASIALLSCNKKVSEQNKAYEDNMEKIKRFQAAYPALKAGLDETIRSVEGIWLESDKEKDAKIKLEKKKIVNNAIRNDRLFSELVNYEEKIAKAKELIARLRTVTRAEFAKRISKAVSAAEDALAKGGDTVKTATAGNLQEAVAVILEVNGKITEAIGKLIEVQNAITEAYQKENR